MGLERDKIEGGEPKNSEITSRPVNPRSKTVIIITIDK